MSKRKVLILFSSSELGGAERSLTRMALAAMRDVAFDLASLDGEGPWADWCRAQGKEPILLGHRQKKHGRFGIKALCAFIHLARIKRYDAVYIIGLRASLMIRFLKPLLKGARLVQGVRWNPHSSSSLDRAFCVVEQCFGWLIDLYICNSEAARITLENCLHIPRSRIAVIYNGLDKIPDQETPYAERPLRIVTVANLSARKGYLEYLENVVLPLSRKFASLRFVFVGRDEMNGSVHRKIIELGLSEAVSCAGFQNDVEPFLKSSKVFVLPSLWNEGCPTSVLEAMAHRLPVVAFSIDGIPELIENGLNGLLVDKGNYSLLYSAIVRTLEDPLLAERLGKQGAEKVRSRFRIEHMAAAHEKAFIDLFEKI